MNAASAVSGSGRVSFDHPPLNEVVFSVQFASEVIDEVGILSRFLPRIEPEYPRLEKHPPVAPATETFDQAAHSAFEFQLLAGPPSHRYWFVSADGTQIVQVQADRLMFNWRQVEGNETYPRYAVLRREFVRLLAIFLECLADGVDAKPAWCELQYVNPVPTAGEFPETPGQLARILNYLVKDPPRAVLPPIEDTQIQNRFLISDGDGSPIGRLYVTVVPGLRQVDMHPAYVITLLARGRPESDALPGGVVSFLDRAHDLIVQGFVEVTTPEMHAEWGLAEG